VLVVGCFNHFYRPRYSGEGNAIGRVRPSVRACVRSLAEAFSDWLAVDL